MNIHYVQTLRGLPILPGSEYGAGWATCSTTNGEGIAVHAPATTCSICGHSRPNRRLGHYTLCCFCVADLRGLLEVFSPQHDLKYPLCEGHVTALGWLVVYYRQLDRPR